MINCSSGDAFGVLSCQFQNTVLQCSVRLPIHTLNYWTAQSVVPAFQLGACLTVIFPIVYLWQCCVCCTKSGVTRSTHFVAFYLFLMCQRCFDRTLVYFCASRCRTSQYRMTFIPLSVSLWNDLVDPVFDGVGLRVSRAGPMRFCWPSCSLLFCVLNYFPFLFFSSIGWQCGAGVFGLIGCQSPSPGLALPIFLNKNNNNNKCYVYLINMMTIELHVLCLIRMLIQRKVMH